ncbi:heme biosynthesis HemY N-terminal domain-containing protein [Snodgrassella sp. ESL0253]|uniref:heme biosynthesis HemY N-terminal domain-containing protein n=1 Tax=Snodgrassella sp. ESL0253 TaxID=2705031 RepID=UPI00158187EA|nr:heme biosynthesis HemY N-terminal domain-containing protein [Snodgrassella sp. ESL0253]NUE65713.1 heme biosynthesis protein HemY [Snodgrassella sp. ESL0253]
MRSLLWLIILFIVAVAVVLGAKYYSGDVYIVVEQTLVRINLQLFIGIVLLAVVLLNILLRIVMGFVHLPGHWQHWRINHQRHQVETALNHAGLAYFEGRFQFAAREAERVLRNKQGQHSRALALLLAAHSADQMDDITTRDRYLNDVAKLPQKQQLSRYLLLAQSALAQHNDQQAKNALDAAAKINPNLTRLVKLQLRYDWEQRNAQGVLQQVDKLIRAGALSDSEQLHYRCWAYRQLLTEAKDPAELKNSLRLIPVDEQESTLSVDIVEKYLQLGMYTQALKWVKKYYPRTHDAALLPAFNQANQYLSGKEQQKNMVTADKWLQQHPQDPDLLLLMGELSYQQQLWGKAKSYLEASLQSRNNNVTRLLLAKVLEQSGQSEAAEQQRNQILATISDDEL